MNDNPKHELYIDILRIFSVIAVIFIHTGDAGYTLYTGRTAGTPIYMVALLMNQLSGYGVPMFMMISGAMLLGKRERIRDVWSKRIPRILAALFVFSVVAYIQRASQGHYDHVGIGHFISKLALEDGVIIPYWYLYAYLGFLITLPFLRAMTQNMTKEMMNYLMFLVAFWEVLLPLFSMFVLRGESINTYWSRLWVLEQFVLLPVMGFVLTHMTVEDTIWIHKVIPVGILVFVTGYLSRLYSYMILDIEGPAVGHTFACMALFLLAKRVTEKNQSDGHVLMRIASWGGGTAFGVYLIHVILMNFAPISDMLSLLKTQWHIPSLIAATLYTGILYVISVIAVLLLQRIPYLKNIL